MRKHGFSLMEMMVVLLITAIIAAATAPMVSKKMIRDAGNGNSPWMYAGLNGSIVYNPDGNTNKIAMIGSADASSANNAKFYIESRGTEPQMAIGSSGGANVVGISSVNTSVAISNNSISSTGTVAVGYDANAKSTDAVAIGRMGLMFRKWIKPSLNRRFESATYNYDLQAWTEGYYNTTFKFLVQLAKDLRETQINLAARWNSLTPTEKANIKRATTEVGHFLLIAVLVGLLDGDKDKERPWLARMAEYQARRLYTEIGAMIPGKSMITEGLKILKSPAAGINTMEDALNLINLMNPLNYEVVAGEEAIIQSGRFKGESKAYKIFFTSPIIPLNKTIYRGLHPEESVPFYKQ